MPLLPSPRGAGAPIHVMFGYRARGGRLSCNVTAICRRSRRVGARQHEMCRRETEIVRQVSLSVVNALDEFRHQFRHRHWNCSTKRRRAVAKLLKMGGLFTPPPHTHKTNAMAVLATHKLGVLCSHNPTQLSSLLNTHEASQFPHFPAGNRSANQKKITKACYCTHLCHHSTACTV